MTSDTFRKRKELSKNSSVFSSTETLASYDLYSQTITLDSVDSKKFYDSQTGDAKEQILKLVAHELTHFYDHIGTLWGQKDLLQFFKALKSCFKRDEYDFHDIVKYEAKSRRAFFSSYHKTIHNIASDEELKITPWKYDFSTGTEFNSKGEVDENFPVLFCTFLTHNDKKIARVPVSILSLIEVNAIFTEQSLNQYNLQIMDEDAKIVELQCEKKRQLEFIYNKNLTEYSVVAHLMANIKDVKDIYLAYRFAALLSRFCLNLPEQYFNLVQVPKELEPWGRRNNSLLHIKDRGYLFLVLCYWSPQISSTTVFETWIEETVESCGLPDIVTIKSLIIKEMQKAERSILEDSPFRFEEGSNFTDRFAYLLGIGREIFEKYGLSGEIIPFKALSKEIPIPPILTNDEKVLIVSDDKFDLEKYNLEKSIDIGLKYWKFSKELIQAVKIGI